MDKNSIDQPDDIPPELRSFEAYLSSLAPTKARVNRDRLMYLAGATAAGSSKIPIQAHASRSANVGRASWLQSRWWPITTAAMVLVSIGLTVRLVFQEEPHSRVVVMTQAYSTATRDVPPIAAAPDGNGIRGSQSLEVRDLGADSASPAQGDRGNYLALRDRALRLGIDALADPTVSGAGDLSAGGDVRNRVLLNELLGS